MRSNPNILSLLLLLWFFSFGSCFGFEAPIVVVDLVLVFNVVFVALLVDTGPIILSCS